MGNTSITEGKTALSVGGSSIARGKTSITMGKSSITRGVTTTSMGDSTITRAANDLDGKEHRNGRHEEQEETKSKRGNRGERGNRNSAKYTGKGFVEIRKQGIHFDEKDLLHKRENQTAKKQERHLMGKDRRLKEQDQTQDGRDCICDDVSTLEDQQQT
ncbi:zwilling [Salminus brasiliensis]|uniref:zwilling n=1 Tax=Salminus brasiliensis TaxID=930266 RepID=UPI003B82E844